MAGHISASVRYGAMLRFSSALPLCTVWWESALTDSSLSSFLFGIEPVCLFKIFSESFFQIFLQFWDACNYSDNVCLGDGLGDLPAHAHHLPRVQLLV